ncbi:MAG: 3'-5' exonuclease [Planctomycetaceae bacterium]
MTFDDVARRLAEEFSQHDPSGLAFRLDAQLEHLLLDEFQDTSLVQWTVLEPLAKGVAHGEGTTFFCVGDVKQAIYGWRGGVAEIFQTVTSRIAGVTERQLDVSFRSSPPVIETVNKVFEKCESFPALDDHEATFVEWARAFPPHATHRNESGYACLVVGPEPAAGENAKEAVYTGAAAHLAELLPKLPPQTTIGVLARKNEAVGAIVRELRKHGLPASQEGGNPLTDSAAVQLIVSAMQLADHPGDTISRFHVAQSPIGPLLDLPREPNDDQATAAAEQIRRSLQMRGYGGVVDDWIEALTDHCHARELDRLRQLAVLSDEYDPRGTLRPADFVRFVKARGVEDPRAARIRVMTVHKAKGLEFDVVLLPQLDEDLVRPPKFVAYREQGAEAAVRICRYRNKSVQRLLPPEIQAAFRQTADRAMRESLCVFYVALTRAAQALYMFVPAGSKSTKSYAGILRSTLAPSATTTAGSVLYECGDPQWHVGSPLAAPAVKAATVTPTRFTPPAGVRRRGRESQAPSQLKGGRRLSIRDVLRSADDRAVQRGRLLHAWFEQLKWIDDALPTDDDLRRSARRLECTDELVAECAREFQSLLAADGLSRILCQAAYRESLGDLFGPDFRAGDDLEIVIEQERRFDVVLDDELVSGSIDRLVLLKRGGKVVAADILDFKSDAIYGDRQTAVAWLVEAYAGQLQCYARAVAQLHQLPQEAIRTRLVLLATPEVVTVET